MLGDLWRSNGGLSLFSLTDYQPVPIVQGIYLHATTGRHDAALDFAYRLGNAASQIILHQDAGKLPTDGRAWEEIADPPLLDLAGQSLDAFLGNLIYTDFWTVVESPDYLPPQGSALCQDAATNVYARDVDGGLPYPAIHATISANGFFHACERELSRIGVTDGLCAEQARVLFATRFSELWRRVSGAAEIARAEALSSWTDCLARSSRGVFNPEIGGSLVHEIAESLHISTRFPPGLLTNTLELVISAGSDVQTVADVAVIGEIFSIRASQTENGLPVTQFARPFSLEISYDEELLGGTAGEDLILIYWNLDSSHWLEVPTVVDSATNMLSAQLDHLTTFAVSSRAALPQEKIYLPILTK